MITINDKMPIYNVCIRYDYRIMKTVTKIQTYTQTQKPSFSFFGKHFCGSEFMHIAPGRRLYTNKQQN